jgi:hypothetical protein
MNAPIPNHYDPENARQLVAFAAATYGSDLSDLSDLSDGWAVAGRVVDAGTDTQVIIWKNPQNIIVAFRGTQSLRNFVTDSQFSRLAQNAAGQVIADPGPGTARVIVGLALEAAVAGDYFLADPCFPTIAS